MSHMFTLIVHPPHPKPVGVGATQSVRLRATVPPSALQSADVNISPKNTLSGTVDPNNENAKVYLPQATFSKLIADLATEDPVTVTFTTDDNYNITDFSWSPHSTALARLALSQALADDIAKNVSVLQKQLADLEHTLLKEAPRDSERVRKTGT